MTLTLLGAGPTSGQSRIVTDNLVFNLDVGDIKTYDPEIPNTWNDAGPDSNEYTVSLYNGPVYEAAHKNLLFDGTDDYGWITGTKPHPLKQEATYEAWIRIDGRTSSNQIIINQNGNPISGYKDDFQFKVSNTYHSNESPTHKLAAIDLNERRTNGMCNSVSRRAGGGWQNTSIIELDTWFHCVITTDANGNHTHYYNGVVDPAQYQYNTSTGDIAMTTAGNVLNMGICKWTYNNNFYFHGGIGVIRVYKDMLTPEEIQKNYQADRERFLPVVETEDLYLHLDAGKVSSYPGTGIPFYDIAPTGQAPQNEQNYHWSLINGATYSSHGGGSIALDGTNDYLRQDVGSRLWEGYPVPLHTSEFWIRFDDMPSANHVERNILNSVLVGHNIAIKLGWYFNINSYLTDRWNWMEVSPFGVNANEHVVEDSDFPAASRKFSAETWYHIVFTSDPNAGEQKVYINGELLDTMAVTVGNQGQLKRPILGAHAYLSSGKFLRGQIGAFRTYKGKALNQWEVLNNYNADKDRFVPEEDGFITNGLIVNLDASSNVSFPDPHPQLSGPTWFDLAGSNDGTLLENAASDEKYQPWLDRQSSAGALSFSGSYDAVDIGNISGFNASQGSFECWVNIGFYGPGTNKHKTIWSNWLDSNNFTYLSLYNDNGTLEWRFVGNVDGVNQINASWSEVDISSHLWEFWHLVVTWDVSTGSYIYVNGSRSTLGTYSAAPAQNIHHLASIGYHSTSWNFGNPYTRGKIGFARFYNRALSQSEATQNFDDWTKDVRADTIAPTS